MRNIKLEIEYDGTDFCGWQVQNSPQSTVHSPQLKKRAIQEVLEKSLREILQEKVKVIGSGRTDAGVHALAQIANFKTASNIPLRNLRRALNSLLPKSIVIKKVKPAKDDFHSCYSAKAKVYRYYLLNHEFPSAFKSRFSWHVSFRLAMKLMQDESKILLGRHDLRSFSASGSGAKTTIRTIKKISVKRKGSQMITIEIEADGFLYNMVRNIVGTLVEIGRGRFKKGDLKKIMLAKDRRLAGPTAPPQGLFLVKVSYPAPRMPRSSEIYTKFLGACGAPEKVITG